MVLDLAHRAREIFESSEVGEKRALLSFLLQNCLLRGKEFSFSLVKPFDAIALCRKTQKLQDIVEDVRTKILLSPEYIYMPDLSQYADAA